MDNKQSSLHIWKWRNLDISWKIEGIEVNSPISIVLIHGFGGCKEHWRHNQTVLSKSSPCYAIDLIGFGASSQPTAQLKGEEPSADSFEYCFDSWGHQIADFCLEIVKKPVILIGNSIGGVIALRASKLLKDNCAGIVLIDCAQRAMDDKRLLEQSILMRVSRPFLKSIVKKRWLSNNLFRNAANPKVIKNVLKQAYPSGQNIDKELIHLLYKPSIREGASEAFRGFINIFDDHLAPDLMENLNIPVDLIWGESDPWEPIQEAKNWKLNISCVRSLEIIQGAGHCPHDEFPNDVNKLLLKIIHEAT